MIEPMTSLAFSVYSSKGVYALLLGSGISRSSGIPTGWDIVVGLIRKVATLQGQDCEPDPAAWYEQANNKPPDYSELLEAVASTPAERRQLLNNFFEPTEEERARNEKMPTEAHKAIAQLVAGGYIKVIITTNFDRLLEQALGEVGITPSVIASPDAILGAVPLAHSPCSVIKVHGDYLDSRLKNTPDELEKYDDGTNRLLDQIFDEYGLIVCGWSAEWDVALRGAIERCPSRRYTTYWSAFTYLTGNADRLCQNRSAVVIKGLGADEFFVQLRDKVNALADMDASHPMTVPMAVATLKQYLADDRYRIRLHDMVMRETEKAAVALFPQSNVQLPLKGLKDYEKHLDVLTALFAAGGYWGGKEQQKLWLRCLERLSTPSTGPFSGLVRDLDYYPTYLLLFAYGISALAAEQYGNLAYPLARGQVRTIQKEDVPLIFHLSQALRRGEMDAAAREADPTLEQSKTPSSRYLWQALREPLREWLPEDARYDDTFAYFEYILALAVAKNNEKLLNACSVTNGLYTLKSQLPSRMNDDIARYGNAWDLLESGLFDGKLQTLHNLKLKFDPLAEKYGNELRM